MKKLAFIFLLSVSSLLGAVDVTALLKRGDQLDAQLKTQQALAVYQEAEKQAPNSAEVLYRIARQYALSSNDVADDKNKKVVTLKALEYAKKAVAADDSSADAHLALAICYGRAALFMDMKTKIAYSKEVKAEADKAMRLNPKDHYTHHVLGAWNYEMTKLSGVPRFIAETIYGAFPASSYETAETYFQNAIKLSPQSVAHGIELGITQQALGKKDKAKESISKGLALASREKDDENCKARGRLALKNL